MCKLLANLCSHFIVTNVNISLSNVFFLCMQICKQLFDHIMKNIHICDHKPNCGSYATDKLAYFLQMQTSFGCIFAPKFSIVQIFYKIVIHTLVVSIPSIGEQEGFILCWEREPWILGLAQPLLGRNTGGRWRLFRFNGRCRDPQEKFGEAILSMVQVQSITHVRRKTPTVCPPLDIRTMGFASR